MKNFNRAAEEITGVDREEAVGRPCCEVFRASICETDCALAKTLETGDPIINRSAYIIDADGQRIPISVSTALLRDDTGEIIGGAETFRDLSLEEALRKELTGRFTMGDMVSRSPRMRRIFDVLPQIAAAESTLLIQGETGTGKELLAWAVHQRSGRADGPFVAVNCGALPDSLLESELFGYKAGAFTGARKDKQGRFALAAVLCIDLRLIFWNNSSSMNHVAMAGISEKHDRARVPATSPLNPWSCLGRAAACTFGERWKLEIS